MERKLANRAGGVKSGQKRAAHAIRPWMKQPRDGGGYPSPQHDGCGKTPQSVGFEPGLRQGYLLTPLTSQRAAFARSDRFLHKLSVVALM